MAPRVRSATAPLRALASLAFLFLPLCALLALPLASAQAATRGAGTTNDDWAVAPGYALEAVGEGLVFPTSLAAVPEPGTAPDDPKLFVAQLQGDILALTRDDRLVPFAHVYTDQDQNARLDGASQQGLAGVCLDPANGYVFATYTAVDAGGILRNRVARFQATPGTLAGPAGPAVDLDAILADVQSSPAHQIGNCQVIGDHVFVGVGDGGRPSATRNPDILLGKVLCFDVEGGPCGDGPWAAGADDTSARAYAWAIGLRNPFALVADGQQLFVAQNGVDIDGFTPITRGGDYRWAGTDQEIATGSTLVIVPSVSPVQMVRVGQGASWSDEAERGRFLAAAFGGDNTSAGVVDLSPDPSGVRSVPRYFVEYVGTGENHVGGVADAVDGLYLAPMLPLADGTGALLRLRYAPDEAHPRVAVDRGTLVKAQDLGLLQTVGCSSCHAIAGEGHGIGPTLDKFGINWRLTERLNSEAYAEQVAAVNALADPPFPAYAKARAEVLKVHGLERTWVWLEYYLQEPRFDNPDVGMPNLGLDRSQALALRAELFKAVDLRPPSLTTDGLTELADRAAKRRKPLLAGALAGFVFGALLATAIVLRVPRRGERRS